MMCDYFLLSLILIQCQLLEMTSASLNGFNERLNAYVKELEQLRIRNAQDHAFQPTFWLRHADFTLARDVFVAVS